MLCAPLPQLVPLWRPIALRTIGDAEPGYDLDLFRLSNHYTTDLEKVLIPK